MSHMDNVTGPLSRRVTHEDGKAARHCSSPPLTPRRRKTCKAFMRLYPGGLWRFKSGLEAGHGK
jgi:hypothetical protein